MKRDSLLRSLLKLKKFKRLVDLEKALKILLERVHQLNSEEIEVSNALGRILAVDAISKFDIPMFERSTMDGYAIRSSDSLGSNRQNPRVLDVVGKINIGEVPSITVGNGKAVKISTGAAIPDGADAVIKIEETNLVDESIEIFSPITPGKNISKRGEDVKKGEKILGKGHKIRPQDIGLLAASGNCQIQVVKKPKVGIISTGSELVDPCENKKIEKGQTFNVNTYTLSALTLECGGIPEPFGIFLDEKEDLKKALSDALYCDVIIFSGGSSVGEYDLIPKIIEEEGTLLVHGIAIRPGAPTALGIMNDKPVFGLPGFPVAAMISFNAFVKPTLQKMLHMTLKPFYPVIRATLKRGIPSEIGRRDFARVKLEMQDGIIYAEPIRIGGSSVLSSMVWADGIVIVPEEREGINKDENVEVLPI